MRRVPALAATALACVVAAPAFAYVLPADAILERVASRRHELKFKSLVLEGFRENPSQPDKTERVWLAIRAGVGSRMETRLGDSTTIALTLGRLRWTYEAGQKPPAAERLRADLIIDFFGMPAKDKHGKRGLAFLDAHGIDDSVVGYGRLDRRVAWVIGAPASTPDVPQLWIDKENRVPVRLITVDKVSGEVTDIRLRGVNSAQTGEWYPRQIEVYKGGQLVERTVFVRVKVNEPIDKTLFKKPS